MIYSVEGKIVERSPAHAVIEANGVGYFMTISVSTYTTIAEKESCKLYYESMYVRDDMPKSYGFYDIEERDLFRKLVSVSGVGGNAGMLMLSSHNPADIAGAINTGNVTLLKSIKGIGEKTAQRIVVDLKGKLGKENAGFSQMFYQSYNKGKEEALMALVMLGFNKLMAEKAIEKAVKQQSVPTDKVDELVKAALKNLS
jgi:holliday junction DNA helicase RuvA